MAGIEASGNDLAIPLVGQAEQHGGKGVAGAIVGGGTAGVALSELEVADGGCGLGAIVVEPENLTAEA